jgi:hypothetical protein
MRAFKNNGTDAMLRVKKALMPNASIDYLV